MATFAPSSSPMQPSRGLLVSKFCLCNCSPAEGGRSAAQRDIRCRQRGGLAAGGHQHQHGLGSDGACSGRQPAHRCAVSRSFSGAVSQGFQKIVAGNMFKKLSLILFWSA